MARIEKRTEIELIEPRQVMHWMLELTKIPRPSGHEEGVRDFLIDFAKSRGLSYETDGEKNVYITKPGQGSGKSKSPVLLQGHMDMVCESDPGVEIDFLKDGLKVYVEDGQLRAQGTTLGADDGVAVACMLALLDSTELSHPPLECLFTSSEETGLYGAVAFDMTRVQARRMINMDSEEEDRIVVGCCGGERTDITFPVRRTVTGANHDALHIALSGFCGGHSGENIAEGRENAVKVLARVLSTLQEEHAFMLHTISGGSKDNAIPRNAEAVIVFRAPELNAIATGVREIFEQIKKEFKPCDDGAKMEIREVHADNAWSPFMTRAVLLFLDSSRNGVLQMHKDIEGLVGFSRNLGVVKDLGRQIVVTFSTRSENPYQLDYSAEELGRLAQPGKGAVKTYARYPGWAREQKSELRDLWKQIYLKETGRKIDEVVIHAGLECGILHDKKPDLDIISVGPDLKNVHSPSESLSLKSLETFWKVLCRVMDEIPKD